MRILADEEAAGLPLFKKGRRTRLNVKISQLKPGQILEVKKVTDWIGKRPPYQLVNRFAKRHGWKLLASPSPDETGWLVKREE